MKIFASLIVLAVLLIIAVVAYEKNTDSGLVTSDQQTEKLAEEISSGAALTLDTVFLETFELGLPEPTKLMPDLSVLSENYIHPGCLEAFIEDAPKEVYECNKTDFSNVKITQHNDHTKLISENIKDWEAGYIGYQLFNQQFKNGHQYLLLTMFWNGGGSGVFSQNIILARAIGTNSYILILQTIHGDRCNDGYVDDLAITGLEMRWSEAATPFRLLNVIDETNWRRAELLIQFTGDDESTLPETFGRLQPFDDVANAASSCAGRVYRTLNLATMQKNVSDVRIDRADWQRQTQGLQAECLKAWADHYFANTIENKVLLTLGEWQHALRDLSLTCPK